LTRAAKFTRSAAHLVVAPDKYHLALAFLALRIRRMQQLPLPHSDANTYTNSNSTAPADRAPSH